MTWTVEGNRASDGTTHIDVMDDGVHITIGLAGWLIVPADALKDVLGFQRDAEVAKLLRQRADDLDEADREMNPHNAACALELRTLAVKVEQGDVAEGGTSATPATWYVGVGERCQNLCDDHYAAFVRRLNPSTGYYAHPIDDGTRCEECG